MHHAFWYISLLSLRHLDLKFPYVTLFKHTRSTNFSSTPGKFTYIFHFKQVGIYAIFLWKKESEFIFAISAAPADVVGEAQYIS